MEEAFFAQTATAEVRFVSLGLGGGCLIIDKSSDKNQ